ncbi:MAG: hypothetical protein C0467_30605 [Planctomycetaceae bacterium]|nr:hypothetical protein [Planctomycetaceae bacterium]
MNEALDHFAARVATDPSFLSHALAEYARSASLDDPGLAAALGCPVTELAKLRLCGMPRSEPEHFRGDVATIAKRFGIDAVTLAGIVRRGQSLARLREARVAGEPGFLLAARDDAREPPPVEGADT